MIGSFHYTHHYTDQPQHWKEKQVDLITLIFLSQCSVLLGNLWYKYSYGCLSMCTTHLNTVADHPLKATLPDSSGTARQDSATYHAGGTCQKKSDPWRPHCGSSLALTHQVQVTGHLWVSCLSQGHWCWVLWFLRAARLGLHGLDSFSCMPWVFTQIGIWGIWRPCWSHELCHVPRVIPEQILWCFGAHWFARGPLAMMVCQDPRFPSRTLYCNKMINIIFLTW